MEKCAHEVVDKERTDDVKLKENVPFSKMILPDGVKKGLHQAGFTYPTVIQANAIPIGKTGIDLLIQSKSGTGKTLIFCTILLDAYQSDIPEPQSLILVPTREIAVQIESILNQIGKFTQGFKAISVIGGLDVTDDRRKLQTAKAIVGTPGRVLHLIQNNVLNTSRLQLLVFDEADKLMSHPFRQDFEKIRGRLPAVKQTIACSATFCDNLDQTIAKFMKNPLLISTENRATLLVGIKQFVYEVPEEKTSILEMTSKLTALKRILAKISFKQCLLFAGSQSRAESYRNFLEKEGWPCEVISGAQDQPTRLEMFKKFRNFKVRLLVATDLMARGVDSENVNLVVNLELPDNGSTYLHRIGRAGRFGSHGIAVSFVSSKKDREKFEKLVGKIGTGMDVLRFPTSDDVQRDFWNFSDPLGDVRVFGTFNQEVEEQATEIDTKTYNIEKTDVKSNILEFLLDNNENLRKFDSDSSQRLPSSNTIDDASSLAHDSDKFESAAGATRKTETQVYDAILKEKAAIPTLVEFLIDHKTEESTQIDLFDDYKNSVDELSEKISPEKIPNFESLLIDNQHQKKPVKKDIFSEYERLQDQSLSQSQSISQQDTLADDLTDNRNTFIVSVTNATEEESSSAPQVVPPYPSPANDNHAMQFPDVLPLPLPPSPHSSRSSTVSSGDESLDEPSSSDSESPESSGFDESTHSDETSGIVASPIASSSSSSMGTLSDYDPYVTSSEESASEYSEHEEVEDENEDDDDEDYSDAQDEPNCNTADSENGEEEEEAIERLPSASRSTDPLASVSYQNAYAAWTNMYWNQLTQIQDYARFSGYVMKSRHCS